MNVKIGILAIGLIVLIATVPAAIAKMSEDGGPSPKIELDNSTINFLAFESSDSYVITVATGMDQDGNYIDPPYMEFSGPLDYNKGRSYQVLFYLTVPEGTSPNSIPYTLPENLGLLYPVSIKVYDQDGVLKFEIPPGLWLDLNYI